MLVSDKYNQESAMGIHMPSPSWASLSPPSPLYPSRLLQSPSLASLSYTANSHGLSIFHMVVYFFFFNQFSPNNPQNSKLSSWVMGISVTEVGSGDMSALPSPNESWRTPLICWATLYYKVARSIQTSDYTWARWFLRSILSSILLSIKLEDEKLLIAKAWWLQCSSFSGVYVCSPWY